VQLAENSEKAQKTELVLLRIQIYEYRLAALQTERLQLTERQDDLQEKVAAAGESVRNNSGGLDPPPEAAARLDPRNRLAETSRSLEQVRNWRLAVENEIAVLRSRIATLEKYLE
jgi:chromosome segregation ATPase